MKLKSFKEFVMIDESKNVDSFKYNSFSELSEKDLYEIAKWGLLGEFNYSGAWDDNENDIKSASKLIIDDFKLFLSESFPIGFKNIPKIIPLYRFVTLKNESSLNKEKLGTSWFANIDLDDSFFDQLDYLVRSDKGKPKDHNLYIIKANINEDKIDIPRSLWLRSCNSSENEIRLKNDKNIKVVSIKKWK